VLREVCLAVIGRPIDYDEPALARLLSARHFVSVRTTPGGPAPSETARALAASRALVASDEAWRDGTRRRLAAAAAQLRAASAAI
jgi:argininosuccinate lyase